MNQENRNPKVDAYLSRATQWQEEIKMLRTILLSSQLTEDFKWGHPCYTFQNNNVVLIHTFKQYCALLFFKGALLSDSNRLLVQQTKNVQAARQIRFTNLREIVSRKTLLKAYIAEALEVEKAGLKVSLKKTEEFAVAEEFQNKLGQMPALKSAFSRLTPGRQRAYLLYFSAPKQSRTRESRIQKCMQRILDGKGLNDE